MALKDLFRKKKGGRSCVVGLDGVPFTLVNRFCDDGTWPFVAKLREAGEFAKMKVTLPEISAVSWPSFMTGANPGVHGIFGFTELNPDYSLRFTNFTDLKTPTFWDRLGEKGKRSVVINQPGTYPAREIPGSLISGFVAIELNKSVKPLRHLAMLRRANYDIDIDTMRCRRDHDQLFRELDRTLEGRRAVAAQLMKEEDWDYFQVVVTGTDRLQHYLMSAVDDAAHKRHGEAIAYYRKIDGFIKDVWERYHGCSDVSREGEGFFMLSDHGFCVIEQEVYINTWLRKQGYLSWEKDPPTGMGDLSPDTRAFCLDPGRIYIHRAGKYPKGRVSGDEAAGLMAEIKEKLLALCYHEEKVLEMVTTREEIYSGPEAANGPDLVCVGNHGFDLKGMIASPEVFGRSDLTGMHTWDDAFFWGLDPAPAELEITRLAEIVTGPVGGY